MKTEATLRAVKKLISLTCWRDRRLAILKLKVSDVAFKQQGLKQFAGDEDDLNDEDEEDGEDTQARHDKLLASMSALSQPSSRTSRKKKERSETVEVCFHYARLNPLIRTHSL